MSFFAPWSRPRNFVLATCAIILSALGWVVYETFSLLGQTPNPTTNYAAKFRQLGEQYVPGGIDGQRAEQAWHDFVEGIELAELVIGELQAAEHDRGDFQPRFQFDEPGPQFDYVNSGDTLPADIARERQALAVMRERGVFERLDAFVANAPGFKPLEPAPGRDIFGSYTPEVGSARATARALVALMRIAHHDGDEAELVRSFDRILAMAQTLAYEPGLLARLVAAANMRMAHGELSHLLMENPPEAVTLRALLASMQRYELPPFELTIEGERAAIHDLIQRNFTDDGRGGGYPAPSMAADYRAGGFGATSPASFIDAYFARFLLANRREMKSMYDSFVNLGIEQSRRPAWERKAYAEQEEAFIDRLSARYFLLKIVAGATSKALQTDTVVQMQIEGLRIMLALELHRWEYGAYPASLSDLVPSILPRLPIDPLHGGSFGYTLVDDDPHGRPYLVYSYGVDGVDNGGREHESSRHLALSGRDEGAGYDFVLNVPREPWWGD